MKLRNGSLIAGMDEVGMGCLAGPLLIVVTAFYSKTCPVDGVTDSKKLSEKKRNVLAPLIAQSADFIGFGCIGPEIIDSLGIEASWQLAATEALKHAPKLDHLYIDGVNEVESYQGAQETVVKGDLKIWQIGAASILAKVSRDLDMIEMGKSYPGYSWSSNKGYGTAAHIKEIKRKGPCFYHRKSFISGMV